MVTRAGRRERADLTVLQIDPSLFTAPYDAALSKGLIAAGIVPVWATRGLRPGEEDLLAGQQVVPLFYPLTDGPSRRTGRIWQAVKGIEHVSGLRRLEQVATQAGADVVHFQWAPIPAFDRRAAARLGRSRPLIFTVHDIEPFNGRKVNPLQRRGYHAMVEMADRLIVHSSAGRDALIARGLPARRVAVVPHGPLPLPPGTAEIRDGRWRIVLFGRMQTYKGADLLVEALGLLDRATRDRIEVIVAGEMQMPLEPIETRARALDLGDAFVLRPGRLTEEAMSALLRSADTFVFPYRSIDASGVLHLVADLNRWLIASDLGAFRALMSASPGSGALVPPSDIQALADAIVGSIGQRPAEQAAGHMRDWTAIGEMTRAVYEDALAEKGEPV